MSVDDQLREAFDEETWDVDTDAALRRVHSRADRARTRRGMALAGVAAVAVVVAFAAVGKSTGNQGAPGPSDPGPSQAIDSPAPARSTAPTPLDGTWRLGPVTAAQIRTVLRQHGLQRWEHTVLLDFPKAPVRYRMTIQGGRVDVMLSGAFHERRIYDEEYVTVTGRHAVLEPQGAIGVNRYRWTMAGSTLRLTFESTSEGHPDVVPAEAFQRALYTVGEWTRVGPAR